MRFKTSGTNMTTKTKTKTKTIRLPMLLVFSAAFGTSCVEKVDDGSTMRAKDYDPATEGSTDHLQPGDREVFIDVDESETVATGCDKTTMDAMKILENHCSGCHSGSGMGTNPVFNFVMDPDKLMRAIWEKPGTSGLRFLKPGDADNSYIFVRASLAGDMPPAIDFANTQKPVSKITLSDGSVLRAWIETCIGDDPLGGATGAGGAGGAGGGGAGGVGAGGTAGTGGAAGAGGTGDTNADGGTILAACATGVANGGNCNAGSQDCSLPDQTTCVCMNRQGGGRQWACN